MSSNTTKCNKEIMAYLIKNQKGRSNKELTEMVNKKFGKNLKESSIKRYKNLEHLKSGRDTKYKVIHEIGAEREFYGYIKVKVGQPNTWKYKGVIEWEKHHGEVPKGYNIIYLDGNRKNANIENLACVSNAELGGMAKYGKANGNVELRKAQVNLAKLRQAIKKRYK